MLRYFHLKLTTFRKTVVTYFRLEISNNIRTLYNATLFPPETRNLSENGCYVFWIRD